MQILYSEVFLLDGQQPNPSFDLEQQFRYELPALQFRCFYVPSLTSRE